MAEVIEVENSIIEKVDAPALPLLDLNIDPAEAYERGKTDINFFAALAAPEVMISALPEFYVAVFQMLSTRSPKQQKKILRFALGLPRAHAKTTFIKILVAWLIAYDRVSFAAMVCATEPLAIQIVSDISEILGSPNMEAVYGRWTMNLSTDAKELKKGMYHNRPVILAAKGAQTAVRGLNIKHKRPDLIFCDDMQTRENDESPTERAKLLTWFTSTLLKTIAPHGDRLIIYVGNMYSEDCILRKLQQNPGWTSLVTGAILENGEPLWPELHSLDDLLESFIHDEALGQASQWFAEIMNDPHSAATSLLSGELPPCPYDKDIVPDGVFLTIDPAGFRDISDDNVIAVHYVFEGKGIVAETVRGILNPEELIKEALSLALKHGASLIGIEDVAYQQTLLFWIQKYMVALHIEDIHVVPLKPHGRSKEARIRQFVMELYLENYYFFAEPRVEFIWQALKYKLGAKKNKDDLLDAIAYALDVRNEYWHLVTNLHLHNRTHVLARVVANNTPLD